MNSKGITLLETMVALTITVFTSIIVIGIISTTRHLLSKSSYYLKYQEEKLYVSYLIDPLNRYGGYGDKLELINDGDSWIIMHENELFLEYKDNVLKNYDLDSSRFFKHFKIAVRIV